MSRTRKAKTRNRRPAADASRAGARTAALAVLWTGTFVAAAYGLHQLVPYVRTVNTAPMRIEWTGLPQWLQDDYWSHILKDLEQRIALDPAADPYDWRVCPYVAERLAGSAWIERVRQVTKLQDGRVQISAEFRKPLAMIERDGIVHLVDSSGVRLPESWYARSANRAGWFVIEGVRAHPPAPGERWVGRDVQAGLRLVRFLASAENSGRLPFRKEIRAIDVGNVGGRLEPRAGQLRIRTTDPDCVIHWGLPPGEEAGVEADARQKLANLSRLYSANGMRFPSRPIDVRPEDGILLGQPPRADK